MRGTNQLKGGEKYDGIKNSQVYIAWRGVFDKSFLGACALVVRTWRAYDNRHFCYRILPAESLDCAVLGDDHLLVAPKTKGRGV